MLPVELVRIFDQSPTDELVVKREAAIAAVAARIASATNVDELFGFAQSFVAGLGQSKLTGELETICVTALNNASPSFVADGHDIEVYVCALGACLKVVEGATPSESGRTVAEILAAALHTGLSVVPATGKQKLDQAIKELLTFSAAAYRITSEASRARKTVPDSKVALDGTETAVVAAQKVSTAAEAAIVALQANAALDREELELLWFCLGDYSAVLNSRISTLKSSAGLVASALEVTKLLRRIPATSHVHMALRNVAVGKPKTLKALVSETEEFRAKFKSYFGENIASKFPAIAPVVSAVLGFSTPLETAAIEVADWGQRLVLELGLAKFNHPGTN